MRLGDAITTQQMLRHRNDPVYRYAQCSLSAARNLLRNEQLPRSFLVEHQCRGIDRQGQPGGEIRFPDWHAILNPLLRESEVVVGFDPTAIGTSELLCDARVMVVVYPSTTHVVVVFRHETAIGGRVAFRKYDNDSESRRRGTYELTNARRLWSRSEVTAVTIVGSALHCAVMAFRNRPRETIDVTSPPASPERCAPTGMRMERM